MLERLRDHNRLIVLGGSVGLAGLAWLDLRRRAGDTAMHAAMPRLTPWSPGELAAAALMWGVMMTAMMLPSATPMLLLFASVQRKQREAGRPAAPTALFAAGYLVVWLTFSVLGAGLQGALQALLLLSPHLATTSPYLGAAFLLLAGCYQLTPWKDTCLIHCQSPLGFLLTRWREGSRGAVRMGVHHGAYCVGCCWALMGLLFVGGVMNLLWVAVLAAFILLEKAVARGPWLSRLAGAGLVGWGGYVLHAGLRS